MTKRKKINKVKPTAKIDTKEKFKNCYIDLSNKELNGEVTEEVFEELVKCLSEISNIHNKNLSRFSAIVFSYISFFKECGIVFFADANFKSGKQEVSIYDIVGMPPKITTTNTEPTTTKIKQEGDCTVSTPFFKKLYTIEDLKTQKIAVHLPTQEEWDRCMVILEEDENTWCDDSKATDGTDVFKDYDGDGCVEIDGGLEHCYKTYYKKRGYTIITLDMINLVEEKEKKKINRCFSKSNIEGAYEQVINLDHEEYSKDIKVIIKYKGKEKVITREDFIDEHETEERIQRRWIGGIIIFENPVELYKEEDEMFAGDIIKKVDLSTCSEVRIRFEGKEKIITREDFEEVTFAKEHGTGGAMLDDKDVQSLDLGMEEGHETEEQIQGGWTGGIISESPVELDMSNRFMFRAWDIISEKMFIPNRDKVFLTLIGDVAPVEEEKEEWSRCESRSYRMVLMQCIDVRDRNGKLIFDGDWLKDKDGYYCFVIYDQDSLRYAVESPRSCAVDYMNKDFFETSEIVGNIYDDPELTKIEE